MAIGKRIKFFRKKKGLTQKQLGNMLGFLKSTSDVRMAQYEAEARIPKQNLIKSMATIFDIAPDALTVPDMYGLKITTIDRKICLCLDESDFYLLHMFDVWQEQAEKLELGQITKEQYDEWRYKFPKLDPLLSEDTTLVNKS